MEEKDVIYSRLCDALEGEGCPICTLTKEVVNNYVKSLLYEYVNDSHTAERIIKGGGFCNLHSWLLYSYQEVLGTAIIYKRLVGHYIKHMNSPLNSEVSCLVCNVETDAIKRYIQAFLKYLQNDAFYQKYMVSDGLCYPHLKMCINLANNDQTKKALIELERQRLEELSFQLSEIIRKSDYRFQNELKGEEYRARYKAIEKLVGKKRGVSSL